MQDASRFGTTQAVAYTGTAGVSTGFGAQTYQVRLVANSACHVAFGASTITASTSDALLPANWESYATVTPGQYVSAVRAGSNGLITATSGTLFVTEIA